MSGPDPALACGSLQRFGVVLQPARSEVRPVGGSARSVLPPYTALPCTVHPTQSNFELGLLSPFEG